MAGVNLHEGIIEVAFEQWIERNQAGSRKILSRLQRHSHVTGKQYRKKIPVLTESRENSLNLGGTTDSRFALSWLTAWGFLCSIAFW